MSTLDGYAAPSGALILAPGLTACAADGHPAGANAPALAPELVRAWHRRLARAVLLSGSSALALTVALGTRALLEGE